MKERKTLRLSDFRGVDFSSSPLFVKSTRASDMCNLYNDYGKTRKRPGWRERLCIRDQATDAPLRINGVFEYKMGEHRDVIIHAGTRFFRVTVDEQGQESAEDITMSGTYERSRVDESLLTDERSQAFFMAGKMYVIGCGDYLVYGSWDEGKTFELRRVYDGEDTYIPTTTVSIDGEKVQIVLNGNIGAAEIRGAYVHPNASGLRATLDDVNLLTPWRKNKLQGWLSTKATDGTVSYYNVYQLDTTIDEDSEVEIVNELTGERFVCDVRDTGYGTYDIIRTEDVGKVITSDMRCGTVYKSLGYVQLYYEVFPENNGDSVITVTFKHTPTADEAGVKVEDFVPYERRVGGCRFGITYGIDGNVDRVFLTGNEAFDNVEFFSAADDATYFSDVNTIAVGSRGRAIVGYARLSDNTLAVFKESGNGSDASIFYRTGYYKQEADDRGNLKRILPIFPTTAGNVGQTVVSRFACVDFGGDPLILSSDGVFGIVLSSNVATADRYTRERSRTVNERLCREEKLSEAVGICYDGRYYLSVGGHCYVADGRFRFYADRSLDESYNYEWWFWDNIPARVFFEVNGALGFGTEDGRICVFDDEHSDRTYIALEAGDLSIDASSGRLSYNTTLPIVPAENDRIVIDTQGLYALYAQPTDLEGERIKVSEQDIVGMSDGTVVYADGAGLTAGEPYTLDDVDVGFGTLRLLDTKGMAVVPSSADFRLYLPISGRELYLTQVNEGSFALKLWAQGEALMLSAYDGALPSLPTGRMVHRVPVCARWVTPVLDLGSASHPKTLLSMSVTAEPGIHGHMTYGYETRREMRMHELRGGQPFSLDGLSFHEFSFDTGFARSDTRRLYERGFNYITFCIRSDTDTDCAIAAIEAIYKFNGYQGGLK